MPKQNTTHPLDNSYTLKSIKELLSNINSERKSITPTEIYSNEDEIKIERMRVELDTLHSSRQQIMKLRARWSYFILLLLLLIVLYEAILVVLIGLDILVFVDYEWLIEIVIGGSIAQILGLPIIVAKFLFNPKSLEDNFIKDIFD